MSRYGGPPHACPRKIRPNSTLVITSQDNILFVLLQRWNCVVDWSRRLPTLTICKRSSLRCVVFCQVALVTCNKVLTLRGKKQLVADYLRCMTKPVNWSTITSWRSVNAHQKISLHVHLLCLTSKAKSAGADPILRVYTNYLPVTRETTKLVSSDQMRSSHCSWMILSL